MELPPPPPPPTGGCCGDPVLCGLGHRAEPLEAFRSQKASPNVSPLQLVNITIIIAIVTIGAVTTPYC